MSMWLRVKSGNQLLDLSAFVNVIKTELAKDVTYKYQIELGRGRGDSTEFLSYDSAEARDADFKLIADKVLQGMQG